MKAAERWRHEELMNIGASAGCKATGSKKRGIDYHQRVYKLLALHRRISLPEHRLLIEPWYRTCGKGKRRFRSPDSVLLHPPTNSAIVIEVKLNWKDGRDVKLIDEYLPIVQSAHSLDYVHPVLITRCLRGYQHKPLLGFNQLMDCKKWQQGDPTPLLLLL